MTAPTTSATATTVSKSGTTNIDALLGGDKWGFALSSNAAPLIISYSFPWINGLSAVFSAPAGAPYSLKYEQDAPLHFGLNTTQQTAATLALTAWSNVANINFQLVSETTTNVGDIRFAFSSASSLSKAWGYASYPSSYWPKGGDVWINSENGSDTDWTIGSVNFEALMHEVGHALGIKHPFEDGVVLSALLDNSINTIMSYTDINDVYPNAGYLNGKYDWLTYYINRETPMVLDIAAIQYIYGANNNYKTGDDTYTFDSTKPFYKTIWDAGGKDTISVSNFSLPCVIDLTPGNYSSLRYARPSDANGVTVTYDGTNNLGIAFNCVIENAIGGSGNDKLTGNSGKNSLDGGPGNDVMYGGAGNDTFDWSAANRGGNDIFYGGIGDDDFVLDSSNDQVIEYANEGTDTIWVNFSFSLSNLSNVENLYCFGSSAFSISGNSADNFLEGSTGDDTIDGGAGTDTVFFNDKWAECVVSINSTGYLINTKSQGTDTVKNAELLSFADQTLDLSKLNSSPTISLKADKSNLTLGSSTVISFTLSDFSNTFAQSDITISSGSLSSFSGSGTAYTATYTPDPKSIGNIYITVPSGVFGNAVGRLNADGNDINNQITLSVASNQPVNITGTAFNDLLTGTVGNENIYGLAGLDTVSYGSLSAAYTLSKFDPTNGLSIKGPDGDDSLLNIERVQFKDAVLAFDTDGTAGQVFRLYQATFKRTPDMNGLGDWITARDSGMTSEQVASAFMDSAEFKSLYGASSTDSQFISLLYSNALLRGASAGEISYWVDQLKGPQTRVQVLVSFSESAENKAALQASISNGILYTNSEQKLVGVFGTTFSGTSGNDNLIGTVRSDIFLCGSGDDLVYGGYGKDAVTGDSGNDLIYGGPGIDTAVYAGTRFAHAITATSNTDSNVKDLKITNITNGTDTLIGVERIKFDDVTLAFDTSGNAGQTYRLYQAAFKRTPDKAGLSGWINAIDNGLNLSSVANSFIQSAEFKSLYGSNPTDSQFVTLLYTNALNRTADTAGLNYWVGQLSSGAQTRAQALIGFSESTENQTALIGVIQNGIEITT